ncbi:uncharacterized protein LOC117106493 [Anneissia japonica]|uniref:uncharacterized protein LOC117106493 n=1 Tax=Anneissia japonica TaxID=1529436 RepID=UPI001425A50C|nr:uncharacterized protein LOC117106493 [Anneissia japonica]XP_033103747.1 uncharacterized protein LOC117106493 [Anneissia japonica]XP_033103748.1 uncharacterized protein LOC117106493 [Anneissia japonica]XP_033103749.1 uncharacterized protein LOC117106493 [Anneissia japonica]XP_033103750.1 uncharacterized protein LOC117106493 [Anneissia japonica]XP_033103751.1 uncharacterized protein LOC117106493 [Anneissia japonica]XP_033103752.1 uncharacterized protein LOC117106493 [Anneissia japonica]
MGLAILIILISSLNYECGFCTRLMNRLQNVTIYEGENATFTCSLELTNKKFNLHEILWKADDVWIESDVSKKKYEVSTNMAIGENGMFIKNDTLVIKNVKLNDTGLITCIVIHQQHVQSSAWLKVNRKILPNPECSHPLKYMKQRYLGDKITTTCKAEPGQPPVQLIMYKILPSGERDVIKQANQSIGLNKLHLDFNWTITRETIADLIHCEVTFISGLNGLKRCTTDLLGDIINRQKGRPEVHVVPLTTQPTVVGETACFLCNVYDHEDLTVVWSLSGREDVTSNISCQSKYCFKNIQHSDNGRMVTCNVSIKYTMVSGSAMIEVVEEQAFTTNEPITAVNKESTPELSRRVAKPEHNEKDTGLDLTQMKILLSISLLIIIILVIVIINLVLRSRRMQGGCFHGNLLRLNTISHNQIDQRYHPVQFRDDDGDAGGDESGDLALLRQRKLSGVSGTEESQKNERETST